MSKKDLEAAEMQIDLDCKDQSIQALQMDQKQNQSEEIKNSQEKTNQIDVSNMQVDQNKGTEEMLFGPQSDRDLNESVFID